MGHIAHVRNQFQSINTCTQSYDYIVNLREEKTMISFLRIEWFFFCKTLNPSHSKMIWVKFSLKLSLWFWKKRFPNFVSVILLLHNYPLLEKRPVLHFYKPEPLSSTVPIWLKLAQLVTMKVTILSFFPRERTRHVSPETCRQRTMEANQLLCDLCAQHHLIFIYY